MFRVAVLLSMLAVISAQSCQNLTLSAQDDVCGVVGTFQTCSTADQTANAKAFFTGLKLDTPTVNNTCRAFNGAIQFPYFMTYCAPVFSSFPSCTAQCGATTTTTQTTTTPTTTTQTTTTTPTTTTGTTTTDTTTTTATTTTTPTTTTVATTTPAATTVLSYCCSAFSTAVNRMCGAQPNITAASIATTPSLGDALSAYGAFGVPLSCVETQPCNAELPRWTAPVITTPATTTNSSIVPTTTPGAASQVSYSVVLSIISLIACVLAF